MEKESDRWQQTQTKKATKKLNLDIPTMIDYSIVVIQ